jgi:hypothetical protein
MQFQTPSKLGKVSLLRQPTLTPLFLKGRKVACISNADQNLNNVLLYWQFQQPKRISLSSKQKEEEKRKTIKEVKKFST